MLRPISLYSLYLKLKGAKNKPDSPEPMDLNGVLKSQNEVDRAVQIVENCGLVKSPAAAKNWDALAALSIILRHFGCNARILDAGAELYSPILPWLYLNDYKNLIGINLAFDTTIKRGPICYKHGNITATEFPENHFDVVTCLSVIEHIGPLENYFKEMARILKPGGLLITSADYRQETIDTRGVKAYGAPVHIFDKQEIEQALITARKYDLTLIQKFNLDCTEAPVQWLGFDFTFAYFTLKKTVSNEK